MQLPMQRRLLLAAAAALLTACVSAPPQTPPQTPQQTAPAVRQALAPTGTLRIAVYLGSPTSLVQAAPAEEMRGLTVDIGRELARRLGVMSEVMVFPRVAEVVAALQRGEADITITNATPERAKTLDFAPPLVALELGVLVPAGSPVTAVDFIDRPEARIGVSQGSSSERALGPRLRHAKLVAMPTLQAAALALRQRELDAFATNKAILFELLPKVPGARVLEGRWGQENLALGTGRGRDAGLPWLHAFSAAIVSEGLLQRAAERAGLRGTTAPGAP